MLQVREGQARLSRQAVTSTVGPNWPPESSVPPPAACQSVIRQPAKAQGTQALGLHSAPPPGFSPLPAAAAMAHWRRALAPVMAAALLTCGAVLAARPPGGGSGGGGVMAGEAAAASLRPAVDPAASRHHRGGEVKSLPGYTGAARRRRHEAAAAAARPLPCTIAMHPLPSPLALSQATPSPPSIMAATSRCAAAAAAGQPGRLARLLGRPGRLASDGLCVSDAGCVPSSSVLQVDEEAGRHLFYYFVESQARGGTRGGTRGGVLLPLGPAVLSALLLLG